MSECWVCGSHRTDAELSVEVATRPLDCKTFTIDLNDVRLPAELKHISKRRKRN